MKTILILILTTFIISISAQSIRLVNDSSNLTVRVFDVITNEAAIDFTLELRNANDTLIVFIEDGDHVYFQAESYIIEEIFISKDGYALDNIWLGYNADEESQIL